MHNAPNMDAFQSQKPNGNIKSKKLSADTKFQKQPFFWKKYRGGEGSEKVIC